MDEDSFVCQSARGACKALVSVHLLGFDEGANGLAPGSKEGL